jgi:hypothetical protein
VPKLIYLQDKYPYEIPDYNGKEEDLINYGKPQEEQYWDKLPIPDFNKLTKKQELDWIWLEEERREKGLHFLNNGVVTYINGKHYKFLQYYTGDFEGKNYPDYFDFQRLYFYFLEFSENDKFNMGDFTIKPRRSGITQVHNSDGIEGAISNFQKNVGLMSATLDKVKKVQFFPMRNAVARYQVQFRPKFKKAGKKLLEKSLQFQNDDYTNENSLNGGIYYSAPETTAFDGEKMFKFKVDEVLKFEGKGFEDIIRPQLKTMYLPHLNKIIGKASLFSTMGTNDKTMRYAISEGRKLWDGSNYDEVDERGKTESGFLRYFISALDTMCVDRYGFSNRQEADKIISDLIKSKIDKFGEGSIEHIRELRELPRTINDVFDSPKLGTLFNINGRISNRERVVLNTPIKERGYLYGKFREDMTTGEVFFDTSEQYKDYGWKLSLTNIDKPNHIRRIGGIYALQRNPESVVGYDPVRLDETISNHISQPAIVIYKKYDHYSKCGIVNRIIGQYYGRKEDNDEVSEQAGFAARYFGALLCPERNVGDKWFKNNGYNEMLIISPYDKMRGIYIGTTGKGKNALRDGIEFINDYIKKPKTPEDVDNLDTLFFEETLDELKTFEADALNTHDLVAALVQAFIGAHSLKGTVLSSSHRVATGDVFWS